jgi:hypothetical protein
MSAVTDYYFTQRTVIGAAAYILTVRYNARMDRYIMDIADASNTPIIQGLPILSNTNIYGLYVNKLPVSLPNGSLLVVDMSGLGADPQLGTLGGTVVVGASSVAVTR